MIDLYNHCNEDNSNQILKGLENMISAIALDCDNKTTQCLDLLDKNLNLWDELNEPFLLLINLRYYQIIVKQENKSYSQIQKYLEDVCETSKIDKKQMENIFDDFEQKLNMIKSIYIMLKKFKLNNQELNKKIENEIQLIRFALIISITDQIKENEIKNQNNSKVYNRNPFQQSSNDKKNNINE
mgnify:FL=1